MQTETIEIRIPVASRTQRTIQLVGRGIKTILTTKVPGKLVIRKKKTVDEKPRTVVVPQKPPTLDEPPIMATYFSEDNHAKLAKMGIKVRDFAYPAHVVGHTNPTVKAPLASVVVEEDDPPADVLETPLPRIPETWEQPHPALLPDCRKPPPPSRDFQPYYPTHRIPGLFSPIHALQEIEFRLQEDPRTIPIRGITTRRLLTLDPAFVDLARYAEMDLEELRRYDRRVLLQLGNGIALPPWRCMFPGWVPSPESRELIARMTVAGGDYTELDRGLQGMLLLYGAAKKCEDNAWQSAYFAQLRAENLAAGLTLQGGTTDRQFYDAMLRRLDTVQAIAATPAHFSQLLDAIIAMWLADGRPKTDPELKRLVDRQLLYLDTPAPFVFGQDECDIDPCAYWGPDAVWDEYRCDAAPQKLVSSRTVNEHLDELLPREMYGGKREWPVPVMDTSARYHPLFAIESVQPLELTEEVVGAAEDAFVARFLGEEAFEEEESVLGKHAREEEEEEEEEVVAPPEPETRPRKRKRVKRS